MSRLRQIQGVYSSINVISPILLSVIISLCWTSQVQADNANNGRRLTNDHIQIGSIPWRADPCKLREPHCPFQPRPQSRKREKI